MSPTSPRSLFLLAFLASVAIMAGALVLEHYVGLAPCPLCIVQRISLILFGLVCLVAAVHGPQALGRRLYALLALLFAGFGAGTAARQIWLQGLPADQLPSCLPSLEYMLDVLPLQEMVRLLLHGTADCAEVGWTLFGLSVPEWSLLAFAGLLLLALFQLLRRR
jgi:disulfide bond formation protein DsbB